MKGKSVVLKIIQPIIKILLWLLGGFIILSISISLLLLLPGVQQFVVDKATNFISTKTNMKCSIGSINIGFPKTIKIRDAYLEDLEEDTLLYCNQISIITDIIPLIRKKINIDDLRINGLKVKIKKNAKDSLFNFHPLIDAFSSDSKKKKSLVLTGLLDSMSWYLIVSLLHFTIQLIQQLLIFI